MKLNELIKTQKKKLRPGRGIGSGKGKTSGRGHKGQKSRSGVAIKSFEGGQMPLYRRLPKRGFKPVNKKNIAILNLSNIQSFLDNKRIQSENNLDLGVFQSKKIISKKYDKLKILGKGELKNKISLSVNFISKQAKSKIEKLGGKLILLKE
jgi:large subunit ribosomal protein L15|tara:strand:- start:1 stop:453 length:453 start_codon:yes stop_codon:yes gene_type:complete